jgi:O-succinylbenzoate synthase
MPRIETIEIHRVAMPLVYPFRTAFGNDAAVESVLVRMGSGRLHGWGESAPWKYPAYSAESAAGAFLTVRDFLAPLLLGREVGSGEELQRLLSPVKGNFFAKAALDLAWWDLFARGRGEPLWRALGGRNRTVDAGADFGVMESIGLLLETVAGAVRAGFKRVKLKFRPGWELEMVAAVRKEFPGTTFHVDCNSAYTLADAPMLRKLDQYGLAMIEQPLAHDDLLDHAELQRQLATPICLDESITSVDRARQALAIGACRWVNIKPGRVGGLTNALKIHDLCARSNVPCWVGGMLESAVGASHCLALATLPNIRYPSDIFPTDRFYTQDLAEPPMRLSGPSQFAAPMTPGAGAEPHPERLEQLSVESARLSN